MTSPTPVSGVESATGFHHAVSKNQKASHNRRDDLVATLAAGAKPHREGLEHWIHRIATIAGM